MHDAMEINKKGVLIVNLGTPASCHKSDVKRFLCEFLMDPYVLSLPYLFRQLLVRGYIAPFRSHESAKAYSHIWTPEGSPLLVKSMEFLHLVQLKSKIPVELAMRYGSLSIADGIKRLRMQGVEEILFLPMYPQYAQSTYETSLVKFVDEMQHYPDLKYVITPPYYNQGDYLAALSKVIKESEVYQNSDYLLFSFHGIPLSHTPKGAPSMLDYPLQCLETARLVADRINLPAEKWGVSFQSRLGKGKWTSPYTQDLLKELPKRGIKRLAIVAPSFTVDCLETLYELGIEGKALFLDAGGEQYEVIPCLNARPIWVKKIAKWINEWGGYSHEDSHDHLHE